MTSKQLIHNIAKQNNVSTQEVQKEILNAIKIAIYPDNVFMQNNIENLSKKEKYILINEFINFCVSKYIQNT